MTPAELVLVMGHGIVVDCHHLNAPRLMDMEQVESDRVDSLEAEYNLIAKKKSTLPAASRKQLVAHYEFYHKDKRKASRGE